LHRDVVEGRAELNFSDWESMAPDKRAKKQLKIGKEVTDGEMPLWFYTPLHPHAKLTDADKQLLQRWSQGGAEREGRLTRLHGGRPWSGCCTHARVPRTWQRHMRRDQHVEPGACGAT
jgi:hypothetical protein